LRFGYTYEENADNFIVSFSAKSEPDSKANCHGSFLGGCEKYYSKGSYAIGFNPRYAKGDTYYIVLVSPDGKCIPASFNITEILGKHTLRTIAENNRLTTFLDYILLVFPQEVSIKSGHVYIVGNSGVESAKIKIDSIKLYDGKCYVDEVKEIQQVGFDKVTINNFKEIVEGKVEKLGKVNVIIGANNEGKTTLLEALYLLTTAKQTPPGFNDHIELLAYIHRIRENVSKSKFLFNFYNTQMPITIEGDSRRVEIGYESNKGMNVKVEEEGRDVIERTSKQKALFINPML